MVLKKENLWIIGNIGSEKREYYKNSERENVITKTLKKTKYKCKSENFIY